MKRRMMCCLCLLLLPAVLLGAAACARTEKVPETAALGDQMPLLWNAMTPVEVCWEQTYDPTGLFCETTAAQGFSDWGNDGRVLCAPVEARIVQRWETDPARELGDALEGLCPAPGETATIWLPMRVTEHSYGPYSLARKGDTAVAFLECAVTDDGEKVLRATGGYDIDGSGAVAILPLDDGKLEVSDALHAGNLLPTCLLMGNMQVRTHLSYFWEENSNDIPILREGMTLDEFGTWLTYLRSMDEEDLRWGYGAFEDPAAEKADWEARHGPLESEDEENGAPWQEDAG